MKQSKRFITSLLSGVMALSASVLPAVAEGNTVTMTYKVDEVAGSATFHLDTTAINYTGKENANQDISYHVSTVAGNYFDDNSAIEAVAFTVTTDETITLSDSKGGSNTVTVTTDDSLATGALNLKETHEDAANYQAGAIKSQTAGTTVAGSYSGSATITFNCTIPAPQVITQ